MIVSAPAKKSQLRLIGNTVRTPYFVTLTTDRELPHTAAKNKLGVTTLIRIEHYSTIFTRMEQT